jgi:hypothetical protein
VVEVPGIFSQAVIIMLRLITPLPGRKKMVQVILPVFLSDTALLTLIRLKHQLNQI